MWTAIIGAALSAYGSSQNKGGGGGGLTGGPGDNQDFYQDNQFGPNNGGGIGGKPDTTATGAGFRGINQTFAFGRGNATSKADATGGGTASGPMTWGKMLAVGGFALLALLLMRGMVKGK